MTNTASGTSRVTQKLWSVAVLSLAFLAQTAPAQATPLDEKLKPEVQRGEDELPSVFREMGVVQRIGMPKANRFLLSSFGSFDLSDGPYTNYSVNLNPGYALSDFVEIYFNYVVNFMYSARPVVSIVQGLQLDDGTAATLISPKPKSQMGFELLWAPAYGKDSVGIHHVLRSDTFLKFSFAQTKYEGDDSGNKFGLGVGKTYFVGHSLGFRFCLNFSYLQTILNEVKRFQSMIFVEGGLVLYL